MGKGTVSVGEHLPSIHEVLDLIPSTKTKQKLESNCQFLPVHHGQGIGDAGQAQQATYTQIYQVDPSTGRI